jgi:hypothetical protein
MLRIIEFRVFYPVARQAIGSIRLAPSLCKARLPNFHMPIFGALVRFCTFLVIFERAGFCANSISNAHYFS